MSSHRIYKITKADDHYGKTFTAVARSYDMAIALFEFSGGSVDMYDRISVEVEPIHGLDLMEEGHGLVGISVERWKDEDSDVGC